MIQWYPALPAGWLRGRVKSIAHRVTDGAHISPDTEGGVYGFVSTRDVKQGKIDFAGSLKTTPATYKYMVKTGCQPFPGDVLFSKDGTVGETAVVRCRKEFVVASSLVIISPRQEVMDPDFLAYVFASKISQDQAISLMRGAGLPRLSVGNLARVEVPVPPLSEQRSIVNFLAHETGQIDALVAKQNEFIALLRERRTSRTAEILAGLGMPNTQLRRVARIQTGVTLSGTGDPSLPSWPYLRVANVQMGHVDLSEIKKLHLSERDASSSMLRAGDVLMTEGGDIDKLGRGTVWDGHINPMLHQNHVFAVRPTRRSLLPEYLALWLDSPIAREYFYLTAKKTTNLASTNKTVVGRLPIRVPSIEEQNSVIQRHSREVDKIDALIAKAQEHVTFAKERRAALITATVTGQFDVRGTRKAG